MKSWDLICSGIANTFRSRMRTSLTVLAIFVGAFTLTITTGLGTGINRYIDDTVTSIGASNAMTVTKVSDSEFERIPTGPQEYDPDSVSTGNGPAQSSVELLSPSDIDEIAAVDGILDVEPVASLQLDYVQHADSTRYVASAGVLVPGQTVQLSDGVEPDDNTSEAQVTIPISFVEPLGFDGADAVGQSITIALTDGTFTQHTVDATIVGIAEESLAGLGSTSLILNETLESELSDLQSIGLPADQLDRWAHATAQFDEGLTTAEIDALKDRLSGAGFSGSTTADELGAFTTVIDTIVLVLNVFAAIALLAAAFGIVNTLLMSVQERTREIGLMKAMGMGGRRVFALFSIEAAFIGFLGSAIGVIIAMLVGTAASSVLGSALLSDLPGLSVVAFDPVNIALTVLLIMAVAFVAGTLPAARAARKNPVDALRYE